MERILEPELMEDELQAKAYSDADFEVEHSRVVQFIDEVFDEIGEPREILDLGCGAGDVVFRIARRFPKAKITAIDGSMVMLDIANKRKKEEVHNGTQVDFVKALIPSTDIPKKSYDLILSTSFLHHLHQPDSLWQTIKEHSKSKTKVFVVDLSRPTDVGAARWIVNEFARNEPEILKEDFYNSLLAAFTPVEVESQLNKAGLNQLSVHFDRYIVVHGEMG